MRNRISTIGLGLSLSALLCGPARAEECSLDPDPGEICLAVSFPWRLPCARLASSAVKPEGEDDIVTVSAESPLLDVRSSIPRSPAAPADPAPRDPWAILQNTPGVLTDRIAVGGRESGCGSLPPVVEVGPSVGQGFPGVGEMLATDMAVAGLLPSDLDFNAFAEIPVETLELGPGPRTPEAPARLLPRRGTNEWRALASALASGGEPGASGRERVDLPRAADAWAGGPLSKDRFWAWGEAGLHEVDRTVLGGQREERAGRSGRFKLNAQIGLNVSTVLAGSRGRSDGSGVGAEPARAPETTWEEDGREDVWAAEGTRIVNSDFYVSAGLGRSDRRLGDRPRSAGPEARIGADGVARGSWFGLREEQRAEQAQLTAAVFTSTATIAHEIDLGTGWRGLDESRAAVPPGPVVTAGSVLDLGDGLALAELWRAGEAEARTHALGLWAKDTMSGREWTTIVGVHADRQDLGFPGGGSPWTLLPRLELNRSLDRDRMTQAWISLARFASRIGPRAAWHVDPNAPALLRGIFADRDGDLSLDPGEPLQLLPGEGIDPLRPGIDPDAVDPHLRPEITDEAALGVQRELAKNFQIGLRATWRRTRDLLEERFLVRDTATGEVFAATAGDWVPARRLTGTLPDGTAYDVPVWDLRPGLLATGGTLLTNGDRRQQSLNLSFLWLKRLADRWMTQGHVTWGEADQRLGASFRHFDDPTNTLGSGDDEGQPVTEIASGRPHEIPSFQASRWSFHALGFVELREGLNLSAALNGRQGQPLPYYRQVARERAGLVLVQLTGRPDALRTHDLLTLDTQLEKEIRIDDAVLTLGLEASNLLNEGTVLAREMDLGTGRAALADDALAARAFRFQVRVSWR